MKIQDLFGLAQVLIPEFVQEVPGYVVELVDFEQVVFRIEFVGVASVEEFLLSVVQPELVMIMQAQKSGLAVPQVEVEDVDREHFNDLA